MIKRGTLCTILGLLLLLAALLLTAYNLRRDAAAGDAAELVLERLTPDLPRQESLSQSPTGEGKEEAFVPDYVLNPELPMPEREIDGQSYIGVLDIPALGLSLPIISTWSYPGLQIAPCRYSGSAYLESRHCGAQLPQPFCIPPAAPAGRCGHVYRHGRDCVPLQGRFP